MIKFFTEKYENKSLAVIPQNVAFVMEEKGYTSITFVSGRTIEVIDGYLDVVARLNEQ